MAGSDNFASSRTGGSGEVPPLTPAEMNSGIGQRLTLDHPSFEKLLAAAWVLQCLHDQLHTQEVGGGETIADLLRTPEPLNTEDSGLQADVQAVAQPFPRVIGTQSAWDVLSARSYDVSHAERVEAQPAVQTGTLNFDGAVNAELKIAEPKIAEPATILRSEDAVAVHPSLLVALAKMADEDEQERSAFNRTLNTLRKLRPPFRVNLAVGALRSVAIATPILILALVGASLLLETWRHAPLHSAQAISGESAPNAEAALSHTSTNLTTTTRVAPDDTERITHATPNRPRKISRLRASHRQVTDPATLSVVQGLSKYEISGLRRRARYGDASAAFTLGMAYEIGRLVPQNCAQAARWVTTAAEAGASAAEYNLGLRYRDGDGVRANRAASKKWLRRAAARRYSKANLALRMLASR